MASSALALFMMFAVTQLMSGTEAQSVPFCSDLFKELTGKGLRVFTTSDPNQVLKDELCVNIETFR